MQRLYPKDYVTLAELSGYDAAAGDVDGMTRVTPNLQPDRFRKTFGGLQVHVPISPTGLQGAQSISETGTVNVPIALPFGEAHIKLARVVAPASLTIDLEEDSEDLDHSAASMIAEVAMKQREALGEIVNDQLIKGVKLAAADSTQASAGGLVLKVDAATDFDSLYPGKVVDVLTAADGTDPGAGKRRLIASISETASPPTITFSTTAQASDGGSGNITLSNAVGVYITGSYATPIQSLADGAATTGTFESIDKAANSYWQGTDGRQGTTTTVPLSDNLLDTATLLGQRAGVSYWDFGLGDPQAINVYKNGKASQTHYQMPVATLTSGFKGIVYQGGSQDLPLVPERRFQTGTVRLIRRDRMTLYGRRRGPAYEDSTGSPWMRFARSFPKESWFTDRLNLGIHDCASIVTLANLSRS